MDFICCQENFFKNPNKLPLNELKIEVQIINRKKKPSADKDLQDISNTFHKNYDITVEKKPVLDSYWIQKEHSFNKYQCCFKIPFDGNDLFVSENKLFIEKLKFLLQCNFQQFWNYVIYEPQVKIMLKSFIYHSVDNFKIKYLSTESLNLYDDIYSKVASIYCRLLTFKESDINFLSEDFVMETIKSNKLITYLDIMKLYKLYSKTNPKLISRIHNLFLNDDVSVRYTTELKRIFNYILLVFDMIGGQVCGFEQGSVIIPIAVRSKPAIFDLYWIEDVSVYLVDIAATLNSFFSNCPPAVLIALDVGLPFRLTYFYNRVYPGLYEIMRDRANLPSNWADIKERILDQIAISRKEFIDVFHAFATGLINEVVQALGHAERQNGRIEEYLSLMSTALEDEFFVFDYHNAHQIDVQLQTLSDLYPQIDNMRMNYILECLNMLPTLENLKKVTMENASEMNVPQLACSLYTKNDEDISSSEKNMPTEAEILDLTKNITDALPHLGDGFIRECLKSYNYNPLQVISAILDNNLPPHLSRLSSELVYVPPEPQPKKPTLAYMGKKPGYNDATQLLNDKSELEEVKDFVLKFSNISFDTYDDEYDDRYDDVSVLRFYDKTDDANVYEHMGNKFEGYELVSDPSESSSEEDIAQESTAKPKNAFCEDPALLRSRREANRISKEKKHDTACKPKGQGQEKKDKKDKTVHKSSKGNHNRKSGAQWKRSKGMIPF